MVKTQTIQDFTHKHAITLNAVQADSNPNLVNDDWAATAIHWNCVLEYQDKRMPTFFSQGQAHTKPPTCEEVLSCLASDANGSDQEFDDWARDLGYDTDSRKAFKLYETIRTQTRKLKNFLGGKLLKELLECEQL